MPDDAPQNSANPRFKPRYLLALAALLFFTWFLWQLLGPSPPIIVSRETTYITEPLLPSGLPGYRKYVLDKLRDGVTPENNAAVPLWQVMGPGTGSDALKEDEWQALQSELQFPKTVKSVEYLPPLYCRANRRAVALWMNEQGRLRANDNTPSDAAIQEVVNSDAWPLSAEANELYDIVETYIDAANDAPWSTEQLPPIAEWLEKNQSQLDLLVEAAQRPKMYSPDTNSLAADAHELLLTMSLEYIQRIREIARILSARAMWLTGEGHYEEAWENLLAIHRWARLAASQPTIVSQLVGIAIDGIACDGTATLLSDRNLPTTLARTIQRDLASLAPVSNMGTSFDEFERIYYLDAIVTLHEEGGGMLLGEFVGEPSWVPWFKCLDYVSVNWNALLVEANQWYDRFAAASQLESWDAKSEEIAQINQDLEELNASVRKPGNWAASVFDRETRSQLLAAETLNLFLSSLSACLSIEGRATTQHDLTKLAAALAVYRAELGEYPDELEQLVPDVIATFPVDFYNDKSFVYHRDADGYLLYSTGENGIDDGGSNQLREVLAGREIGRNEDDATNKLRDQIPTGADDISIRLPRPPFELPEPPAEP